MLSRPTADAARVLAMAAVLAIHATELRGPGLVASHDPFSADALAVLINQAARFCVPLFILLSGFGLAARERQRMAKAGLAQARVAPLAFWLDRLGKILLPFALWSLIYRLGAAPWDQGAGTALAWTAGALPGDLLSGGAHYHLYFIAIIAQCYLLFPLLIRLRSAWWTAALFALAVLYTAPMHELLPHLGIQRPELPSWAFPAWLCWFHFGIRAGLAEPRPAAGGRILPVLALCAGLALLCGEWWWNSTRMADPGWFGHFHRWSVLLYTAAAWWTLRAWDAPIAAWLAAPRRAAVLAWLSGVSFAVYLGHPLLLSLLLRLDWTHPLWLIPALGLSALAAAGLISLLLRPLPRLARALGW